MNGPLSAANVAETAVFRPSLVERLKTRSARLMRWEFWPAWAFYPPVVAYIVLRCLRSPYGTPFTAANPGILASGVVGETKHEALAPLQQNAPQYVAEFLLLRRSNPLAERMHALRAFVSHVGGYPVVCKPDIGQRGRGVAVIRNEAQAESYLADAAEDVVLQRYIGGAEFGVFVYRDPKTSRVELLSIVRKCFPQVIGDGQRTLAELIRDDARARLIAPSLWQRFAKTLHEIPEAGRTIVLVEIGAHSRGSLFLDGNDLQTEALRAAMSAVLDAVPGYHFGRIDLRCPDEDSLRAGQGLQVMEMNGVTAESAHIYNPGNSLIDGWRTMIKQWRLAIEIGEANAAKGAAVTSVMALFRLWRADQLRGKQWL
ncbi:MAG: hypothetical protein M0P19_04260 [Nevskia sp.]|nr:hypothetical protein [Nevskia sp.]MCK9383813.1 hypothetical protein [Nevskia sp.]